MREFPSPQEILKVFAREPGKTFRLRELVVELGLRSSQARDLKNALKSLARHKRIVYLKKNHFALVGSERKALTRTWKTHGGQLAIPEQSTIVHRKSAMAAGGESARGQRGDAAA